MAATRIRRRRPISGREIALGLVFCVPALAGLGTFVIFPLFQAIFLSTRGTDINGNPSRSVGGANFAELFTPEFGQILLHTLFFTLFVVVVGLVLPLALAVPLTQRLPGMRAFRTLFTLPFAYSASAASVVWLLMLDPSMSPVNWLLRLFGATAPGWTTESPWALLTVAWATVWVVAGFNRWCSAPGWPASTSRSSKPRASTARPGCATSSAWCCR
jgi:sn-glycerol 3-phosphate transport system permease protein